MAGSIAYHKVADCGMKGTNAKGPATLKGGEQCWCPDKNIPEN